MEGLGELGFWVGTGIVLAAWILANGQKEREKERQKHEMLRALLATDGKGTSEILQYMRERDAADAAREHAAGVAGRVNTRKVLAVIAAIVAGFVSFLASVAVLNRAFNGATGLSHEWPIGLGLLLIPFIAAALLAFLAYILVRGKKNDPASGA